MMKVLLVTLVVLCFVGAVTALADVPFAYPEWNYRPDQCDPGKGRIDWIISKRQPDYGWGLETPHANIAIAVHGLEGTNITDDDMRKMGLQLEDEVAEALFRNFSAKMDDKELALYIHALLATNRDPRNFHGNDLVGDLLHRVASLEIIHPYLVLALCNAKAVTYNHLEKIESYAQHDHTRETLVDARQLELKALALKAFACADSMSAQVSVLGKFRHHMKTAAECLILRQNKTDGRFGNIYTTSLAVQALTAAGNFIRGMVSRGEIRDWDEDKALKFLEKEAYIEVNMVKAYYIELALHARTYNFIKNIHNMEPKPQSPDDTERYYIQYSVQSSLQPAHYFTLTLKVEPKWNFFDVMKQAARLSDNFRFSYSYDIAHHPVIFAIADIPNDAEENMFWRVCRQNNVTHTRHSSITEDFHGSPEKLLPNPHEHIKLVYLRTECPK